MEFRVLSYFISLAKEGSITSAANHLHLSQPTLSRQLKDLEDELGVQLFIRGGRKIKLTEEGRILRSRAEEILGLMQKTEEEVRVGNEDVEGNVYICSGEIDGLRDLISCMTEVHKEYPKIKFHIESGDDVLVLDRLSNGTADFGVGFFNFNENDISSISLPTMDNWCIMMRKDSPFAGKSIISMSDLKGQPLIIPRRFLDIGWAPIFPDADLLNSSVIATYSLLYNASLMVEEGLGYVLCFDRIINTEQKILLPYL